MAIDGYSFSEARWEEIDTVSVVTPRIKTITATNAQRYVETGYICLRARWVDGSNTDDSYIFEIWRVDMCACDQNNDGRCDMLDWLLFGEDWGRTDCPQ